MFNVIYIFIILIIILATIVYIFRKLHNKDEFISKDFNNVVLNSEEMEKYAAELAQNQSIIKKTRLSYMLIPRMNRSYNYIKAVYRNLSNNLKSSSEITKEDEWLLDNFYIIEEQVKEIRKNLSKGYYSGLPGLKNSFFKGYPRIYSIAFELVSHSDGKIDEKTILNFVKAYQTKAFLSSGEIWALSLMIRVALIENIKSFCEKLTEIHQLCFKADKAVDFLIAKEEIKYEDVKKIINENVNIIGKFPYHFVEHMLRKLRKEGDNSSKIIQYIDKVLIEYDTNIIEITERAHQMQANLQVSLGNSITSLKTVSTLDWAQIFEILSPVEQILRQDPDGTYPRMDFESRDYYRHEIERIAKSFDTSETFIAKKALECAKETANDNTKLNYMNHVGFYIIGKGKSIFENKLLNKKKGKNKIKRVLKTHMESFYIGLILISLFIAELSIFVYVQNISKNSLIAVISIFATIIPVSEMVVELINWVLLHIIKPTLIPKIELHHIPDNAATIIVVPALLPDYKKAKELIKKLEVYYHANKEKNLYFAIVGDFKDGENSDEPQDKEIVDCALAEIKKLNKIYSQDGEDIFYYFHRRRLYNESQKKWMGWERKRGALLEFNELIIGSHSTSFNIISGDIEKLKKIKYVITLDADTNLPIDTAKKLIGTMLHPLNSAFVDKDSGIVVEGYGLLQPRISVSLESSNASLFSRIFAGNGGLDPYTTAVSDIYQDLFGEGIFTGKGIYDLNIFRSILKDMIPENTILSHDLLEGSFVRTGLLTDVELIDGYPSKYNSYIMRLHRWTRGDWQLLPYLSKKINNKKGDKIRNPLNLIAKYKIIDNLRRSLFAPMILILIFMGFSILPGRSFLWIVIAVVATLFPFILNIFDWILRFDFDINLEKHHRKILGNTRAALYQGILTFIFIPYQAYIMLDAIFRTIIRIYFTKKNLLEWVTADDMERKLSNDLKSFIKRMWPACLQGIVVVFLAGFLKPIDLKYAVVISMLWIISPYIAFYISKPIKGKKIYLNEEELNVLSELALKTWTFFEDFVDEKENFLPPDNYQEDPPNGIAERTSPTNIGLYLLSVLSARDLGFITTTEMYKRLKNTFDTIIKIEKWNGHLYNWYDTKTLEPLRPYYVSTVDSGNFIGYIITLQEALEEYLDKPLVETKFLSGLKTILVTFKQECCKKQMILLEDMNNSSNVNIFKWKDLLEQINENIVDNSNDSKRVKNYIEKFLYEFDQLFIWTKFDEKLKNISCYDIFKENYNLFLESISIKSLKKTYEKYLAEIKKIRLNDSNNNDLKDHIEEVEKVIDKLKVYIKENTFILNTIKILIQETNFKLLFDEKRQLFSIGYNVEDEKLTKSYYDLLASEARQASFIAIAKREIDKKHWFKLGRMLTSEGGYKGLVSWSGTMFEYFMPLLIMKNYNNSLFDETYTFVVEVQKKYAKKLNIPWGISESGFYAFDINLNYQYKAFGVPNLGLKRGLSFDKVIAPYSTLLALNTDSKAVIDNIKYLKDEGLEGKYGFYEAADYTPERISFNKRKALIKSFMAHHQGMSFVALNNFFNDNIMQVRFHKSPMIKAAEILLQEKVPSFTNIIREVKEGISKIDKERKEEDFIRVLGRPKNVLPEVHVLSNGKYSVMVTDRGTGYSKKGDIFLTRWRNDIKQDYGTLIFIQNINSNNVWSLTYAPFYDDEENYKVNFSSDKVEFSKKVGNIDSHMEIIVSPDDNAEIRKITIKNNSKQPRIIEVTSFSEVCLSELDSDLAHPAFNKLFIKTVFLKDKDSILVCRRPRSAKSKKLWALHSVFVRKGETIGNTQFETDRSKFIGRGRNLSSPAALDVDQPLSNTEGNVLDPIMSLRKRIKLMPGQSGEIIYVTAIAENYEEVLKIIDKYKDEKATDRAFEMAWTRSRVELSYLNLKAKELGLFQKLLTHILFISPQRKLREDMILKNNKGQTRLWAFGISGDLPIVLIEIESHEGIDLIRQLLKAHEYWRMKGIFTDLVILSRDKSGYIQPLHDKIKEIISASFSHDILERHGRVYLLQEINLEDDDIILLNTVASLKFEQGRGSVYEQMTIDILPQVGQFKEFKNKHVYNEKEKVEDFTVEFDNGYGGFDIGQKEYRIKIVKGRTTPAPWINIISNPQFGFYISESGGGYTWALNSRENKLTPWYNDPILDIPGEVIYVRDEEDGSFWTITPLPAGQDGPFYINHGFGYTIFKSINNGIKQELVVFVPKEGSVKINIIKIKNNSKYRRKLALVYYIRPVMGVSDYYTAPYIVTEFNKDINIMKIMNVYRDDFNGKVIYVTSSEEIVSFTGDRMEFFGNNGDLSNPQAMKLKDFSRKAGAGYDPCAAIKVEIELDELEEKEITFLLGYIGINEDIENEVKKYKGIETAKTLLQEVRLFWDDILTKIIVSTPDKSFDLLINGWLLYQTISCRLWARSAFYQAGGAYGFRDQLQDSMNIVHVIPEFTKKQILNACEHQYIEGDVQHWWHPITNKGIRTKFSDDLLWLPFVTADYISKTKDYSLLEIKTKYLEDRPLDEEEEERYNKPKISDKEGTVYEHCIKAIDYSLKFGEHGIPLMGSGDWNDGMNMVGNKGKGESVWLGWFLYKILKDFSIICKDKGDILRYEKYEEQAEKIAKNIENSSWDGSWYVRAYFDDGTPLGSANNTECKIDSIAQSWAVISGAAEKNRAKEAMEAVNNYLVNEEAGIIKLLAPPFDNDEINPGYIKGYAPGVRENGGQYTHAAIWVILAYTKLGDGDKAWKLYNMINPINHTRTPIECAKYKVEPYVVAADVYSVEPHIGRGGWTWYTGAAGWMYRVGVEDILGIKKYGDNLKINPCIPKDWNEFKVEYTYKETKYKIYVKNPENINQGIKEVYVDGKPEKNDLIELVNDKKEHNVLVILKKEG